MGLVPEQAAVTTTALHAAGLLMRLTAQLKSHLFNSLDKHLPRPWDQVPLGNPVYLGRQNTKSLLLQRGQGPGGRKGHGTLEELQEMWCGEPTQYVCPDSGGMGAVMGLEQQITWSGLTIQAPRHNSTGKVKAGGMEAQTSPLTPTTTRS